MLYASASARYTYGHHVGIDCLERTIFELVSLEVKLGKCLIDVNGFQSMEVDAFPSRAFHAHRQEVFVPHLTGHFAAPLRVTGKLHQFGMIAVKTFAMYRLCPAFEEHA